MRAMMIARITVKDPAKLQHYMTETVKVARDYGAEMVFRGRAARALNGADDHEITVVARFPSLEKLHAWYDSEAYAPLLALRDEAADMHMTSYEAVG